MGFKLPKTFVYLSIFAIAIIFSYFYLVFYPKNVVNDANQSLKKGQSIIWYLDKDSSFFQMLEESKVKEVIFRDAKNKMCSSYQISEVNKIEDLLYNDIFKKNACSKLCLSLTPSRLLRGSFCIYLDNNMKITSIDKPIYWINYRSSKL